MSHLVRSINKATLCAAILSSMAQFSNAAPSTCSTLMRHNTLQGLRAIDPSFSEIALKGNLCAEGARGASDTFILNDTLKLSSVQLNAAKALLCDKERPTNKVKSYQRVLKGITSTQALREYGKCLTLAKNGVSIEVDNHDQKNGVVNLSLEMNKPGTKFEGIKVSPPDAFSCSGPLGSGADKGLFDYDAVYGSCKRNPLLKDQPAVISVQTSKGSLDINFAPLANNAEMDLAQIARRGIQALPNIAGCSIVSVADRILSCSELAGWQRCNAEMIAGNILDCRVFFRPTLYPNRREVQISPEAGQFEYSRRGSLSVAVRRNRPHEGVVNGSMAYTINFQTPVRPPSSENACDVSCPLFAANACNRDCVFADHILELPSYFGIASFSREDAPSCERALTGHVELSRIDAYRAYNLCEANNAWGRTTTGFLFARVSKYYYFNDFRTTHVVFNGRRNDRVVREESWNISNQGERVRAIADLQLPFTVVCNP